MTKERKCPGETNSTPKHGRKLRLAFVGERINWHTVRFFIPSGNFRTVSTSGSVRVESESISLVWSTRPAGPGLLAIIGMVRAHVKKNLREGRVIQVKHKPRFTSTSRLAESCEAVEVDISRAYLSAAVMIGAIGEKIERRLMECSKETRLMAIGSLATTATEREYVRGRKVATRSIKQETKPVWDWIVSKVDELMNDLAKTAGGDFLFYWTDAIFARRGSESLIVSRAAALKLRVKAAPVRLIKVDRRAKKISLEDGRSFPLEYERTG